ncbi:MAG TPA: DNA-binding protein [Myxococcales bacterium]|nr:hypothetical protein [Deltaproteobacteria bacterium]HAA57988.1 DNA-binding protein [Myxococcales bacterium]|tara:strand:- start:8101 stop:8529 length:429 start_codon:yes stop_codon:yes gene_type:complete
MNKKELIAAVSTETGLTKKDIEVTFSALFDAIKGALGERDRVAIKGFGSFSTKDRAPKTGRHPKTGEILQIPARTVPVFNAGSDLKEVVANPKKAKKKSSSAKKSSAKKAAPKKSSGSKKKAATSSKKSSKKTTKKSSSRKK